MMKSIIKFLILLTLYQMIQLAFGYQRIKLKDVNALTLYRDRYTIGRKPIPQLSCSGLCSKQPDVVQCTNQGFDGLDYQWKCQANLDKNLKFNKITVNCEGYDHPNDPYIIAGSCGLEYQLGYRDHSINHKTDEASTYPFWIFIGFVVICILFLYCKSNDDETPRARQGYHYQGPPTAPPSYTPNPPGFKSDFTDTNQQQNTNSSTGPGFWSGLGLGGLGGYFFGRNSGNSYTSPPAYSDTYYRPYRSSHENTFYQQDCYSDRSSSNENTYNAEGFGSTKRR